jgi:Coenzyme PQQ synthesis protein D (PqqD)
LSAEFDYDALPSEIWEFPVGDELVLARPGVPGLFCLNGTARAIWEFLRSNPYPKQAAAALAAVFGISQEQADRDVQSLLQQWVNSHLTGPLPSADPAAFPSDLSLDEPAFREFYALNGRTIQVAANNYQEFVSEIAPRLAHLRTTSRVPDFSFQVITAGESTAVTLDGVLLSVEETYPRARTILLQELARVCQPDREWLALLHAGACGFGSKCVIFPAASHSGKTTLAAATAYSGFRLYTDDFAGLEKGKLSVPIMPFALAVREGSWHLLRDRFTEFDELPIHIRHGEKVRYISIPDDANHQSAQPVAVVFTRWVPNSTTSLSALNTLEALLQLKDAGLWVSPDRVSIETFLNWLDSIPKYSLVYGDLNDAVAFFRDLLQTSVKREP